MASKSYTGVDAIRDALKIRSKQMALNGLASNLQMPVVHLELFIRGHTQLPTEILQQLTNWLWQGHATYNAETNLLEPTTKMATVFAMQRPPSIDKTKLPTFTAGSPQRGPQPVSGVTASAAPKPRAGWATRL